MPTLEFRRSPAVAARDDAALIRRIVAAYRMALRTMQNSSDTRAGGDATRNAAADDAHSMWLQGPLLAMRDDVHAALLDDDATVVTGMLRDPGRTNLLHGFEDLSRIFETERLPGLDRETFAAVEFLGLVELGRAVGVHRMRLHGQPEPVLPEPDALLGRLDEMFGFAVDFPNPFPDEAGLATLRGVLSYRAPPALYQAWRMHQLLGARRAPKVLEIGAGLGRTAYYARKFGITDYTIVDLPISLVAQANFLGRVVGEGSVRLYGETAGRGGRDCVKLLPPSAFLQDDTRYDLVLNVDSMTEMSRGTAQAYCDAIQARADVFLSINHEGLAFTVAELMRGAMFQRSPYWMRPGYVEELGGAYPGARRPSPVLRMMRRWVGL